MRVEDDLAIPVEPVRNLLIARAIALVVRLGLHEAGAEQFLEEAVAGVERHFGHERLRHRHIIGVCGWNVMVLVLGETMPLGPERSAQTIDHALGAGIAIADGFAQRDREPFDALRLLVFLGHSNVPFDSIPPEEPRV